MSRTLDPLITEFEPAGAAAHDLTGSENPSLVSSLCEASTGLGLMSLGVRHPLEVHSVPQKSAALMEILKPLLALKPRHVIVYAVTQFPGTVGDDTRTMVFLTLNKAVAEALSKIGSIWWPPWQKWEDWMLFSGNRLKGYVCSHEEFRTIYGLQEELKAICGSDTRPIDDRDKAHCVRGIEIGRDDFLAKPDGT
jgi:hypothetical protein